MSPTELARRGGKMPERREHKLLKSHKQRRSNERAKLRKEYL
jgi:hypothetical protein